MSTASRSCVFFLMTVVVGLQQANAAPKQVNVNCAQGKSINDALAKLDSDSKDYIVNVTGICNENVVIADFQGNSLVIQGDPTATISGVPNNPFGVPVVQMLNSRQVTLQNLTVNVTGTLPTGNQAAIAMNFCNFCNVRGLTVNTPRSGITAGDSQGTVSNSTVVFTGTAGGGISVVNSSDINVAGVQLHGPGGAGQGLNVDENSRVRVTLASATTPVAIDGFAAGITIRNNSYVYVATACGLAACATISNNSQGIRLEQARAFLFGLNVTNNPFGAVYLGTGSSAEILGPFAISNSTSGIGLTVTHNSHAAVFSNTGNAVISGNVGRAVSVGTVSSVQFNGPNGAIQVNGAVNCDGLSAITGTLAVGGTPVYGCGNTSSSSTPLP